jgi:hypothetical protein
MDRSVGELSQPFPYPITGKRRDAALFNPEAFPNVAAVQIKWAEVEKGQAEFVNSATEPSNFETRRLRAADGTTFVGRAFRAVGRQLFPDNP